MKRPGRDYVAAALVVVIAFVVLPWLVKWWIDYSVWIFFK